MNCKEVIDLLSDYLANELPEEHFAEIRSHLRRCRNCTVLLDSLKTTIELTHNLEAEDFPAEVVDDLRTFLKSKIRQQC
jgi:anti-sigma factor RsiW